MSIDVRLTVFSFPRPESPLEVKDKHGHTHINTPKKAKYIYVVPIIGGISRKGVVLYVSCQKDAGSTYL